MAFPPRKDLSDDVAELWRFVRQMSERHDLRFASLGPGEDGLEVRNAAGNAIYKIGEAGGKLGLLVNVGGTWRTVDEDAQTRVDALSTTVSTRIGAVEGRVSTVEGSVSAVAGRVSSAEGKIATAQTNISSLQSSVSTINGQLGDFLTDAELTVLNQRISGLQNELATVRNAVRDLWAIVREFHPSAGPSPL